MMRGFETLEGIHVTNMLSRSYSNASSASRGPRTPHEARDNTRRPVIPSLALFTTGRVTRLTSFAQK